MLTLALSGGCWAALGCSLASSTPDPGLSVDPNAESPAAVSPASLRVGGVVVQLLDSQLWRSFHTLGTEMIITKAGRSVDIM